MVYSCFIDTNVWLELYLKRQNYKEVEQLVGLIDKGEIKAYTSESVITTIIYILESSKIATRKETKGLIGKLLLKVDLIPVSKEALHNALASGFKDIEDAILYFIAYTNSAVDCFVTFNTKDFIYNDPKLPVYKPRDIPGIDI